MGENMEINCPKCGKNMVILFDTPLCLDCDNDIVYEFNVFIKKDMEEKKK